MLYCNKFVLVFRLTDKISNEILQEGNLKHRGPWTSIKSKGVCNL